MNTIVAFFKNIFSLSGEDSAKIGLSQFNKTEPKKIETKTINHTGEVKLSDLMRKSY